MQENRARRRRPLSDFPRCSILLTTFCSAVMLLVVTKADDVEIVGKSTEIITSFRTELINRRLVVKSGALIVSGTFQTEGITTLLHEVSRQFLFESISYRRTEVVSNKDRARFFVTWPWLEDLKLFSRIFVVISMPLKIQLFSVPRLAGILTLQDNTFAESFPYTVNARRKSNFCLLVDVESRAVLLGLEWSQ